VFVGRLAGALPRIFTISPEGGNPEPLLSEAHAQTNPAWSPDGSAIVYGRDPDGEKQDIALYRFDLHTGRSARLPGTEGLYAPLWSPDGRHLAARSAADGRLFVLDPNGEAAAPVSRPGAQYPAWSADSRFLYFNAATDDHVALLRVNVTDGKEEKVADVPFKLVGSYGSWTGLAPDGSPLALRDRGQADVYALTLSFR
jgi:hypothetical protein